MLTVDPVAGNVGIGNNTPATFNASANNLVIGTGIGNEGLTVYSGTGSAGGLYFADGTAGSSAYRGYLSYDHSGDDLAIGTSGTTKVTITDGGNVGIGVTDPDSILETFGTGTNFKGSYDATNYFTFHRGES